jgi:hypothetical protein
MFQTSSKCFIYVKTKQFQHNAIQNGLTFIIHHLNIIYGKTLSHVAVNSKHIICAFTTYHSHELTFTAKPAPADVGLNLDDKG